MYQEKKIIKFVPTVSEEGQMQYIKMIQNDFNADIGIYGTEGIEGVGDPGSYILQRSLFINSEGWNPIFYNFKMAPTCGFCNPLTNTHVWQAYQVLNDIVIFKVLDAPNGNPVDFSFEGNPPSITLEFYYEPEV